MMWFLAVLWLVGMVAIFAWLYNDQPSRPEDWQRWFEKRRRR